MLALKIYFCFKYYLGALIRTLQFLLAFFLCWANLILFVVDSITSNDVVLLQCVDVLEVEVCISSDEHESSNLDHLTGFPARLSQTSAAGGFRRGLKQKKKYLGPHQKILEVNDQLTLFVLLRNAPVRRLFLGCLTVWCSRSTTRLAISIIARSVHSIFHFLHLALIVAQLFLELLANTSCPPHKRPSPPQCLAAGDR